MPDTPAGSSATAFARKLGLEALLEVISGDGADACDCLPERDGDQLLVDASECDGDLGASPNCRETVVGELVADPAKEILVRSNGFRYRYRHDAAALLSAAGRFIGLLGDRENAVEQRVVTEPLAVASELRERVDPIADIGVESGLLETAARIDDVPDVLTPELGLTIGHYFVDKSIDEDSRLKAVVSLDTGSEARIYARSDGVPLYAVDPVDLKLSASERGILLDGYERIANGEIAGERAATHAIEEASDGAVDPMVASILRKHTQGYGILEDLFADPEITDVYVTAPVSRNPLRVVRGGESMSTNVFLSIDGAHAIASRIRRTSGRAFSRATPTVDAKATLDSETDVRVAGVTKPVSDGIAFAFRQQAADQFTLPKLVRNGTLSPDVAGFLSVAVESSAATLIAGTRGAGKTTLLGTLLYELTADTRTVVIEDTPELPIESLQSVGRDVQALRTGTGHGPEVTPAEALRTALRLGDGALVVGEIRGEEAQVLYEAMRIGANANAVLGTIHGDGADDVYERVVSDLGVEPSSFAVTDLVVTTQATPTPQGRDRRVSRIEEVIYDGSDVWFEPLYESDGTAARPTGRIEQGESRFIHQLSGPEEAYADVRESIAERADRLGRLAGDGRTKPTEVAGAYADRIRAD
ncbi:ATPase, T2SS/T4P/T4SS family [Halorhabdus sp. BNX81]|uniref:ATPase, T2SS/T4P/T4SS family n=1 Tax=Halorhabdus sp. BNX81 TaxID=2980181 RepID=UPI0023DD075E|nr:ATPase, T2SS/T4P/T4SS family [Halorhabdus sp. BNX81]